MEKVRAIDIHNPDMICKTIGTEAKEMHIMYLESEIHVLCKKAVELEENLKVADGSLKIVKAQRDELDRQVEDHRNTLSIRDDELTEAKRELIGARKELSESNKKLAESILDLTSKSVALDITSKEADECKKALQLIAGRIKRMRNNPNQTIRVYQYCIATLESILSECATNTGFLF